MRTLREILEAARDGNRPSPDECYFAMLVLDALGSMDFHEVLRMGEDDCSLVRRRLYREEAFRRRKTAHATPPDVFLGPGNTPGTPEQIARRRAAKGVIAAVEQRMASKDGTAEE